MSKRKQHSKKKPRRPEKVRAAAAALADCEDAAAEEPEAEAAQAEASLSIRGMGIDTILGQLSSIRGHAESMIHDTPELDCDNAWQADIDACEAATAILSALQDEGVADPEAVRDLLFDYRLATEESRKLREKYETPKKPEFQCGVAFCGFCGERVSHAKHCGHCGGLIKW